MFKYTAVIIEPRDHNALEFVLKNFFINLSNEWGFIIYHGRLNKVFIENIINNNLKEYKHRIDKIIQLDIDNLTIKQYNKLCKTPSFYKIVNTDLLLLFQVDTLIINKEILNNFLKYDYVGAPWKDGMVGNGGLSLRRKNKMIEITEKVDHDFLENEDTYFSYQNVITLDKPDFNEAQKFSIETIFHEKSFGIHAPWKHLNKYEIEYLINKYPDIATLIKLNTNN